MTGQVIHSDGRGVISRAGLRARRTDRAPLEPEHDWFVVIEGGGWVGVGEERTRVAAGEAVLWPADVPHAAWTEHSEMRAFVVEFTGADDRDIVGVVRWPDTGDSTAGGPARRPRRGRALAEPRATAKPAIRTSGRAGLSGNEHRPDRGGAAIRPGLLRSTPAIEPRGGVEQVEEVVDLVGGRQVAGLLVGDPRRCPRGPVRRANGLSRRTSAVAATIASRRKVGSVEANDAGQVLAAHVLCQLPGPPVSGSVQRSADGRQSVVLADVVPEAEGVQRGDLVAGPDGPGVDACRR